MNIFILHQDPRIAAQMYCDKHVPKMVVELYQQMGSAMRRAGVPDALMPLTKKGTPLKGGYHNHPCTRWVGDNRKNFCWAAEHGLALCAETSSKPPYLHIIGDHDDDFITWLDQMPGRQEIGFNSTRCRQDLMST